MDTDTHIAVSNTLYTYGHCYDSGDWDGLRDVFTEDAVFNIGGQVGPMPRVMEGADAIVSAFRARRESIYPTQRRHICTNLVVQDGESDDECTATSYLLTASTSHGIIGLQVAGRYDDVVVRESDGKWRIKLRVVDVDANVLQ